MPAGADPLALVLTVIAVTGSVVTAARGNRSWWLRLAHLTMALAMAGMLVPAGPLGLLVLRLSLAGLILVALIVGVRLKRCATARPCVLDLTGMAVVLAGSSLAGASLRLVVALAVGWAVSSLWLRWEQSLQPGPSLRTASRHLLGWEPLGVLASALAMVAVAVTMPMP